MKGCTVWPGTWASAWCKGVDGMTAVAITAIICVTIIILACIGTRSKR